jgi:enoyl-CoA hydratase/carnithine racemase
VCSGLVDAIDECEKAHVRVLVLHANPNLKVWSAGHNVKEIPLDGQDPLPWTAGFERLIHRVRNCRAPVIAMVHASVWGGAFDSTCAAVRYANHSRRVHCLEIPALPLLKEMVAAGYLGRKTRRGVYRY